jgi:hypothetical protein
MWDVAQGEALRPVLVLGSARGSVRGLAVLHELGLLAAAHSSGKVGGGTVSGFGVWGFWLVDLRA